MAVLKVQWGSMLTRCGFLPQDGMSHKSTKEDGAVEGIHMIEARVVNLESDVKYIRRDVDELKDDVKSID